MDTVLWLCPSLPTETLKCLSSLPILIQESFWWWQCSDRYIISLSPPPCPFPPFFPSLISLMVSVDVKHHVYLHVLGFAAALRFLRSQLLCGKKKRKEKKKRGEGEREKQSPGAVWKSRWTSWAPVPNKAMVSVDVKQHFNQKGRKRRKSVVECKPCSVQQSLFCTTCSTDHFLITRLHIAQPNVHLLTGAEKVLLVFCQI